VVLLAVKVALVCVPVAARRSSTIGMKTITDTPKQIDQIRRGAVFRPPRGAGPLVEAAGGGGVGRVGVAAGVSAALAAILVPHFEHLTFAPGAIGFASRSLT
jgi:hypothetical protein